LYPVKVDGANRTAVLDLSGKVLPGAAKALGKENDLTIAKMYHAVPTYRQAKKKKFPHTNCYFSTPSQRVTKIGITS
jgi:hypothetical protein